MLLKKTQISAESKQWYNWHRDMKSTCYKLWRQSPMMSYMTLLNNVSRLPKEAEKEQLIASCTLLSGGLMDIVGLLGTNSSRDCDIWCICYIFRSYMKCLGVHTKSSGCPVPHPEAVHVLSPGSWAVCTLRGTQVPGGQLGKQHPTPTLLIHIGLQPVLGAHGHHAEDGRRNCQKWDDDQFNRVATHGKSIHRKLCTKWK